MAPISELRGAIPLAILGFGWPPALSLLAAVFFNGLVAVIVLGLLYRGERLILACGRGLGRIAQRALPALFAFTRRRHSGKFRRWSETALIMIVATPLPLTGAWTGALAAFVFGVPFWRAVKLIISGVLIAGLIVTGLTVAGQQIFAAEDCIDINTASAQELEKIVHIGASRAQQIINLRTQKPFESIEDLVRVKGIGEKSVQDIRQEGLACVNGQAGALANEEAGTTDNQASPAAAGAGMPATQPVGGNTTSTPPISGGGGTPSADKISAQILVADSGQWREVDQLTMQVGRSLELKADYQADFENLIWNFGNGDIKQLPAEKGASVAYIYKFPGKYILTLRAEGADQQAQDTIEVIVIPAGLLISEFLPNPKGADSEDEWIELVNQSDWTIDLGGLALDDEEGGSRPFLIPAGTYILPGGYLVLPRPITKLALNNSSDAVRLLTASGQVLSQVSYQDIGQGQAVVLKGEDYQLSSKPTPGFSNIVNPENKLAGLGGDRADRPALNKENIQLSQLDSEIYKLSSDPLKKISLLKARFSEAGGLEGRGQDSLQESSSLEANLGRVDQGTSAKRQLVLILAVIVSLGLVVLGGLLKK